MPAIIVGYARTPFVRFDGRFATVRSTDLGGHAIRSALARAGVAADRVDRVVAGQVLQAAVGQNPGRQSAVAAGLPLTTPAITLNAVCLSGSEAVAEAARLIAAGDAHVVVAVGQESMSLAPHAWSGSRAGKRYGAIELVDTLEHDGLTDAFAHRSMGAETEDGNRDLGIDRAAQDTVAAASHARAASSATFLAGEIEPFEVRSRAGVTSVSDDDGIRPDTTVETLGRLRPAFAEDGTITAGNASQITDGAAAVVLVSPEVEAELGLVGIATVESHALVAGPDTRLHEQPANAILAALAKLGTDATELRSVEINEAFAAVSVRSTATLGIDPAIVNPHGGAIALGHPIGASGTRLVGTLARELRALGTGSLGAAALCGGGGQGSAIVLRAR